MVAQNGPQNDTSGLHFWPCKASKSLSLEQITQWLQEGLQTGFVFKACSLQLSLSMTFWAPKDNHLGHNGTPGGQGRGLGGQGGRQRDPGRGGRPFWTPFGDPRGLHFRCFFAYFFRLFFYAFFDAFWMASWPPFRLHFQPKNPLIFQQIFECFLDAIWLPSWPPFRFHFRSQKSIKKSKKF